MRRMSVCSSRVEVISLDPYEVGGTPSHPVAGIAGGEDSVAAVDPPDEAPGFATDGLVEWVRIADFGGYRLPAVRAGGA